MHKSERHQALADFLRKRRACLTPAEVGLPAGLRRRTPGLRREEVAQLANIGTSWYVWLEQGRDVHPSPQVLESLAQALRLSTNERRHLFLLAGQPLPAPALAVEECVSPELQQMLDDLNPTPATVIGRRWDYLAWNKAADAVFAISEASPPHAHNLIWHFFTNPEMRERFTHWEPMARGLLAELRTASARYPGDAWFTELIEDLKQASPEFCRWWPHHEASRSLDREKIFEHPTLGHLEFRHLSLQVFSDPDIRVTAHIPDAQTRAKLQRFRTTEENVHAET
ncbi:XRE family transcriptional regulator [Ktedonosporobacter rubrisoli]|uniref:XRE family transcriptional regulator n=1 Tax=Ktedonosporobacter rubrisoli TaxID=2509675 RepID=A0A4P6JZA0_KTERU|nr:helix-turn-helix transcriptional regulator [Ktedonosporobacter rubrisoli]QBD81054.1 XRE family transcriptional regulator [Ktedonosporobacter rubrisoli]